MVKVRGYIHADAREYLDDPDLKNRDTFLIRRARPVLEATFFDVADFRLMPDFGGGTADAVGRLHRPAPVPLAEAAGGQVQAAGRPGAAAERDRHRVPRARLADRAWRPTGTSASSFTACSGPRVASYELGVFNGVVDGGSGDARHQPRQGLRRPPVPAPRSSSTPTTCWPTWASASSGTWGNQRGHAGRVRHDRRRPPAARRTRCPGCPATARPASRRSSRTWSNDEAIDATVIGKGKRTRLSPQGYFYYGGLGLLGEYVISSTRVVKGASSATPDPQGLAGGGLLRVRRQERLRGGDGASSRSTPSKGTWGALELGARYNALLLDEDSFPTYANASPVGRQGRGPGARWPTGTGAATSS